MIPFPHVTVTRARVYAYIRDNLSLPVTAIVCAVTLRPPGPIFTVRLVPRTKIIWAALLFSGTLAHAQPCYWQAPEADYNATPPPYWIERCDLGTLPTANDPTKIDHVELINDISEERFQGRTVESMQRYLPGPFAKAIAPNRNGMPLLLSYILQFAPKWSSNKLRLIFETQSPVFHFLSPVGAVWIGTPAGGPRYNVAN